MGKTRSARAFELYKPNTLRLSKLDLSATVDRRAAEAEILDLQEKLYELQVKCWLEKRRTVFVFEGWDAAGKGGVIKRLTGSLDPRGYKVWPVIYAEEDHTQHYLWRFLGRMPTRGSISIFDRSWYGRVLVDRVEGQCEPEEWQRAYDEINAFEATLTGDGVTMVKFFLHIDKDTQLARFKERERNPLKHFKVGEEDWDNRKRWRDYEVAYQEMFDRTHRPDAPWVPVAATDKRLARVEVLRRAIEALEA